MSIEGNEITLKDVQTKAAQKAEELTQKHGRKVHPLVFVEREGSTDYIVGFIKEPNRMDKMQAIDTAFSSPMKAGYRILELGLIREESDHRFLNEDPAYDEINLGAYQEALTVVQYSANLAKKKER